MGYSIEYVVSQTKIHPSVIKNIEAGRLSGLGFTYLKGFIKIYANFLGVELGGSLEELDEAFSPFNRPKAKPKRIIKKFPEKEGPPQPITPRGPSRFKLLKEKAMKVLPGILKKTVPVISGLLMAWILFFGIRFVFRGIAGLFKRGPRPVAVARTDLSDIKFAPSTSLDVALTAKKKCLIRVRVDGKLFFEGVLEKGSVERWSGDKEIEFKISDGSAVALQINGKSIPTLTAIRKPIKSLKITPSGITVDK